VEHRVAVDGARNRVAQLVVELRHRQHLDVVAHLLDSAHASDAPSPLAFQLFGRRSTCTVEGLTEIEVGDDGREPKQQPNTRGSIEIFGGPCPGEECVVGLTTQFALNPITFAVRWASDPTFNGLLESGNSSLTVR
jgi:hypothetical protein